MYQQVIGFVFLKRFEANTCILFKTSKINDNMCFITCICSNLCFSLLLEFVATFKYKNRYWYRNDYLLNLLFSVHFYTLIILSILLKKSAIHCFLSYSALKGKKNNYTKTYTTFNKISCFLCFFSHTIVLESLEETKTWDHYSLIFTFYLHKDPLYTDGKCFLDLEKMKHM